MYVAAGITRQGRSSISTAILLFEGFLANNVHFGSLDQIIEFIHNVITEPRVYRDCDILDEDIDRSECYFKLMANCGFSGYIPTSDDEQIVWDLIQNLNQENVNRLFYKNNLYYFCDNKSISKAIEYILERLNSPFLDPNEPPEEIKVELDELKKLFFEYVYYRHIYTDKIEHVATMFKSVSILTDTDSSIISFDAWYRYTLAKVYDKPLKIKNEYVDEDKLIKESKVEVVDIEEDHDTDTYDFFTDEFRDMKKSINDKKIVPQDNLRYSIINIMAYCLSEICKDYMQVYSGNYFSHSDDKCLLVMKNEFLFKRLLLMATAKKHYSSYQEMQEGNLVPADKALKITGMEMDKSTLQETTREKLKQIMNDDILACEEIDQMRVLTDIVKIEKEIHRSLGNGETTYYKPMSIKSMNAYDNPMGIQGIKAALIYNDTKDEDCAPIDLEARNSINVVKTKITPLNIEPLKVQNPRVYEALNKYFAMKEFSHGITAIAVPLDAQTPKWIIPYIDYYSIINDNVKTFPLESIGLGTAGNASVNHSNILRL